MLMSLENTDMSDAVMVCDHLSNCRLGSAFNLMKRSCCKPSVMMATGSPGRVALNKHSLIVSILLSV